MVDELVDHRNRGYHFSIINIRLGYEGKYIDGYTLYNRPRILDRSVVVGGCDILVIDYDFLLRDIQVVFCRV